MAAGTKSMQKPVTTLKGHGHLIRSLSYFSDGQRMISGSDDKTARKWDLKMGKEIEEVWSVCENKVWAVAVSRDSRWIVTCGGDKKTGELKVCEVETGIVKLFEGHSDWINCIDISADSKLLASGSDDKTTRLWNLEAGKPVANPFESVDIMGAVRFSTNSKKLAIKSIVGRWLEVWDVHTQKLDVRIGKSTGFGITYAPMFWTNKNKNILATFTFTDDDPATTIYEFDASTLETVGTPFEAHTKVVIGLALSSDGTLLASASFDDTIKLWAFESRQLLASFDVQYPLTLVFSPDSCKLAYTTYTQDDYNIHICNTPPNLLAQARAGTHKELTLDDVLKSDATRRPPVVRRKQPIYVTPMSQRPPTIDPHPSISLRLRRLLRLPSRMNTVPPNRNDQLRGPLDFPATSPLPHPLSGRTATQGHSNIHSGENSHSLPMTQSSVTSNSRPYNLPTWWPIRAGHAQPHIVDVPLAQGKERNAAADAPRKDDDIVPDEYFDPPSPNPNSQQPAAQTNAGEHGSDRCCFCF